MLLNALVTFVTIRSRGIDFKTKIDLVESASHHPKISALKMFFLHVRYAEVCKPGYSFGSDSGSGGTGHFTQVVWKGSTVLGIGSGDTERNGMYCTYVVGRYKKAGNFIGRYKENVEKGSFSQDICGKLDDMIAGFGSGR